MRCRSIHDRTGARCDLDTHERTTAHVHDSLTFSVVWGDPAPEPGCPFCRLRELAVAAFAKAATR